MRISMKGKYAIELMIDLAAHNTGQPIKIKDIARRQEISVKYLEQIISSLHKASLVKSIRGSQGGYVLAKEPEEYTVEMILKITERTLSPSDCVGENSVACENKPMCVTNRIWEKLEDAISGVLGDITLADLLGWQRELGNHYSI
ncbi:MAG: Rrf2 family transcriptional regulator [Lachnospiraceae bacterium]|nr:Rrf2 family transcriptional regulator [Lachnospiraceae bacterium]